MLFRSGITVADGESGGIIKGGAGGAGLSEDSRAVGAEGGALGMPGKNSDTAFGGRAGYYILGNSNVYWSIRGEVVGNAL